MAGEAVLESLLAPIPGTSPTGTDCSGLPAFLKLSADVKKQRQEKVLAAVKAARSASTAANDPGGEEFDSGPGWRSIRQAAQDLLEKKSKDMTLAVWWTEAALSVDGFDGLAAGLSLVDGVVTRYWDSCFPSLSRGDDDKRSGVLGSLERHLEPVVADQALLVLLRPEGERRLTLGDRRRASGPSCPPELKGFDEDWEAARQATPVGELRNRTEAAARCIEALDRLERASRARFRPESVPSFGSLRKTLESIQSLLDAAAPQQGGTADGGSAARGVGGGRTASNGDTAGSRSASLPIASRNEAVRALQEVAAYFRSAEPHSPVPYLLERAVRWSQMPFETLLHDMVQNDQALEEVEKLLRLRKPAAPST
jgi:type VI secretion system protein ImpA